MLAAEPKPAILTEQDFDPPLKRQEAAVPGYWTIREFAAELGVSPRYVHYLITGNPKTRLPQQIKAYKADTNYLIADVDALAYIKRCRNRKKA
ncbi:MAG: hypothetical protein VKJ02_19950 [Snowella sp.]|nr:hypothetical protein [Snowella sp.]